jgi:NAD(P)-dependent dehydrogenase (short-subunit alcohol dehydrogenase family)
MDETADGLMAGKTVLITGGTSGIGRATAVGLAALGAHLAIVGRDPERTEAVGRELRAAGAEVDVFVAAFLLTDLLLDRLRQSAPARVVTVSSNARASGRIDFADLQGGVPTPARGPTASPSSPTSCSAMSWLEGCAEAESPQTFCIPEWCARASAPRTLAASSD